MSYYAELSNADTRKARQEVSEFKLPDDWQDGRPVLRGIAIDDASAKYVDDAIFAHANGNNEYTVSVSVVDLGSFMPHFPALQGIAQSRVATSATRKGVRFSMWPERIARPIFSLKPGVDRPVLATQLNVNSNGEVGEATFTRGILRVKRYSHETARNIMQNPKQKDPASTTLRRLRSVVHSVQCAQQPGVQIQLPSSQETLASIVALSSQKAAEYTQRHRIPGVYRIGVNDASHMLRYAAQPSENGAYLRHTSPLRRFADYLNQANIIAHLIDEPYPFDEDAVHNFLRDYEAKKQKHATDPARVQEFAEKIQADDFHACITAVLGRSPVLIDASLRKIALDRIIARPDMSRYAVAMFITYGVLERKGGYINAAGKRKGATYLEDNAGNRYSDVLPGKKLSATRRAQQQKDDVQTIVSVAGILEAQFLRQQEAM